MAHSCKGFSPWLFESITFGLLARQLITAKWWSKSVYLMADGKERDRDTDMDTDIDKDKKKQTTKVPTSPSRAQPPNFLPLS